MASIEHTQVNLDGLLEILGKNLYSSPSVALRELVQNAHDACERYRIETKDSRDFNILITIDAKLGVLEIIDNGSGLTNNEIREFLATVGSGFTRVLRQSEDADSMIGYFGLGFLSAYVVSEKVEVYTTSYQTPEETWLFSSIGGKTFSISRAALREQGTCVRLYLSSEYSALADESFVYSLIKKYCCLLDIPITINGNTERANMLNAPWQLSHDISNLQKQKRSLAFAKTFENDFEPICTIEIPEDNPYFLKGVLWVQDGGSYASSDNRNISIFIRGMFITKDELDLLPRWAGFIGGVFESIHFNPTASRESLQKDAYFKDVAEYIKEQLIVGLRNIVLSAPESWRRILNRHGQALVGAAIADQRLFDVCRKTLKVPTSLGDMTIPALLSKSNSMVYVKPSAEYGFEEILFRAQNIPIVMGYFYGATSFCQLYGERDNISVRILGDQKNEAVVFPPSPINEEVNEALKAIFNLDKDELIFSSFEPVFIPLIVIQDQEILLKKRIEQDSADKRIGAAALSLARLHTKSIEKKYERRVYINMNNPLVIKLSTLASPRSNYVASILRGLMDSMNFSQDDNSTQFSSAFERINDAILALLD